MSVRTLLIFIISKRPVLQFGAALSASPSGLGDDHLGADLVEALPQVRALQVHAGVRRRAHSSGLRALQQRVVALCCSRSRD